MSHSKGIVITSSSAWHDPFPGQKGAVVTLYNHKDKIRVVERAKEEAVRWYEKSLAGVVI